MLRIVSMLTGLPSACHLCTTKFFLLSPSGLISKVALLCSDCEKNVYIIIHCLVYTRDSLENMGVSCAFMF